MKYLILDLDGRLRSGWRAAIFVFAFVLAAAVFGTLAQIGLMTLRIDPAQKTGAVLIINSLLGLIPAILVGWFCGKLVEKLPFRALGADFTKRWLTHLIYGLIIGAFTISFAVGIAYAFGGLRFALNQETELKTILSSLTLSFLVFGLAAAFEEVLFRGYVLQTFARSGLAWLAILITSAFFGAVHLGNPNANLISTANTVLAGVWFSIAYLKTRDLWFVWGLHLMWNWMQGSFFGIEVSGINEIATTSLFREIDSGPSWLTGQTYGIEGGVVCTISIVISIIAIYFMPNLKPDAELLTMTSRPVTCRD